MAPPTARPKQSGRPSPDALAAADGRTIPHVIAPDLDVLFCGINPGRYSGATGHHFARPGNRFWKALHLAGFTDRQLSPEEDVTLPRFGLGVTNLVGRTTRLATDLDRAELVEGGARLERLAERWGPAWVAVLGVGAYRTAFGRRDAPVGEQPGRLGPSRVWLLPNPSGLNARYQLPDLVQAFGDLRTVARGGVG